MNSTQPNTADMLVKVTLIIVSTFCFWFSLEHHTAFAMISISFFALSFIAIPFFSKKVRGLNVIVIIINVLTLLTVAMNLSDQ